MDFDFKLPEAARPVSARPMRVAEAIRNELNLLLRRGAADPRLSGVTLTRVEVSSDIKSARLYFRAGRPEQAREAEAAMRKARGFFRSHLARTLNLRYTPELLPFYDNAAEAAERVERLLDDLERERPREEPSEEPSSDEE